MLSTRKLAVIVNIAMKMSNSTCTVRPNASLVIVAMNAGIYKLFT